MIVPMKKVSLIIMGDKKTETLEKLRKLGIIHIEIAEGSGQKLEELKEKLSTLESASFLLEEKKTKTTEAKEADVSEVLSIAKEVHALTEENKDLLAERTALMVELERFKDWGDIDPQSVADLAEDGIDVSFYEMAKAEYEALGENVKTLSLEKSKSSVKFMIIKSGLEGEDEVIDSLDKFRLELPQV